jgi:hypothetical protein
MRAIGRVKQNVDAVEQVAQHLLQLDAVADDGRQIFVQRRLERDPAVPQPHPRHRDDVMDNGIDAERSFFHRVTSKQLSVPHHHIVRQLRGIRDVDENLAQLVAVPYLIESGSTLRLRKCATVPDPTHSATLPFPCSPDLTSLTIRVGCSWPWT